MAAFGFIVAYFLVTVAAPVYLKALGEIRPPHLAMTGAAILLLCIPAVGTVYPLPPAPVLYFPYVFLVYMAVGVAWILTFYGREPAVSEAVRKDLDQTHARFRSVAKETAAPTLAMETLKHAS
jgi:amino acid transporter